MSKKKTPEAEARTKEELLAVATRVFLRDGYQAASMKAIADEGDCTTGKLYSNYTKKEDFLAAFCQKLLAVNYETAQTLVKEEDHPVMLYLLTIALELEACQLNDNFHELYYMAYTGKDTVRSILKAHKERLQNMLVHSGRKLSEQEEDLCALMVAGLSRSLIAVEYFDMQVSVESKMLHYINIVMNIYGFSKEEEEQIKEQFMERKEQIHEAAYAIIIRALSGKF